MAAHRGSIPRWQVTIRGGAGLDALQTDDADGRVGTEKRTKAEVRARIIEAALALGSSGRAAITIRGVAEHAGISPALMYTYFADKAALLEEMRRVDRPYLEAELTEAERRGGSATEMLANLCRAYVEFARRHPWLYETGASTIESSPAQPGLADALASRLEAILVASNAEGDPGQHARFMTLALDGLIDAFRRGEVPSDAGEEFVASYAAMLVRGL